LALKYLNIIGIILDAISVCASYSVAWFLFDVCRFRKKNHKFLNPPQSLSSSLSSLAQLAFPFSSARSAKQAAGLLFPSLARGLARTRGPRRQPTQPSLLSPFFFSLRRLTSEARPTGLSSSPRQQSRLASLRVDGHYRPRQPRPRLQPPQSRHSEPRPSPPLQSPVVSPQ
jgi:hypothetical protein